jgi:hypothetical protein
MVLRQFGLAILVGGVGLGDVLAQTEAMRRVFDATFPLLNADGSFSGWFSCYRLDSQDLTIRWSPIDLASQFSFEAPFGYVMAGHDLGGGRVLLGGVSDFPAATRSRLSCYQCLGQAPGLVEVAAADYLGVDLRAACFSADLGMLFVADGVSGTVRAAPWAPTAAMPDWSMFVTMFDSSSVALLQSTASIALSPTPNGVVVRDLSLRIGREATYTGAGWAFSDWSLNGPFEPRWHLEDAMCAPTQGDLVISREGETNPGSAAFEIRSLDDGSLVAQGTHPGTGNVLVPAPAVFHALPGRSFDVRGGTRRSALFTPVVRYPSASSSSVLAIYKDMSFRPQDFGIAAPFPFALTMDLKRPGTDAASYTAHVLVGIRNGANDPVVESGGHRIVNGFVLESFAVDFAAGQQEKHLRRVIEIPDDDGFANLVVFFQIVVDDGAGGWVTSTIKGSAIRPRPASSAAATSSSTPATASMSPEQYLQHCRALANAADKGKARTWVLERNPGARQQLQALRQRIGGN